MNEFVHGHLVPCGGTIVACTTPRRNRILCLSSSGGGLFGRPTTQRESGALLICERDSRRPVENQPPAPTAKFFSRETVTFSSIAPFLAKVLSLTMSGKVTSCVFPAISSPA